MRLLTVDTSGPVCGAAVLEGEKVLSEMISQNGNNHSTTLMPMVERCLEAAGKTLEEMDGLAVVTGPGSFTGVRIGVATVKALAHGSGKPCYPVDALEALAESTGAGFGETVICPIQDARAGQVYGSVFRGGRRLMEDRPMKLEDYLAAVRDAAEGPWLFTGDGTAVHRESIREQMGSGALFARAPFCFLRPSAAGLIAAAKGIPVPWQELKEYYLRPPNAEKNRKLLEAMRHA